jgi:hypothetical protein
VNAAIYIVHWPGEDVPACAEHAQKLISLGRFMGFAVSSTLFISDQPCMNCENERPTKEQNVPQQ